MVTTEDAEIVSVRWSNLDITGQQVSHVWRRQRAFGKFPLAEHWGSGYLAPKSDPEEVIHDGGFPLFMGEVVAHDPQQRVVFYYLGR